MFVCCCLYLYISERMGPRINLLIMSGRLSSQEIARGPSLAKGPNTPSKGPACNRGRAQTIIQAPTQRQLQATSRQTPLFRSEMTDLSLEVLAVVEPCRALSRPLSPRSSGGHREKTGVCV